MQTLAHVSTHRQTSLINAGIVQVSDNIIIHVERASTLTTTIGWLSLCQVESTSLDLCISFPMQTWWHVLPKSLSKDCPPLNNQFWVIRLVLGCMERMGNTMICSTHIVVCAAGIQSFFTGTPFQKEITLVLSYLHKFFHSKFIMVLSWMAIALIDWFFIHSDWRWGCSHIVF